MIIRPGARGHTPRHPWLDGSRECRTGTGTAPPPLKTNKEARTPIRDAEGHEPHGTGLPMPSKGTSRSARGWKRWGGGKPDRSNGSDTRASTPNTQGIHNERARATRPRTRNAQPSWNGVPTHKEKRHPNVTIHHTNRESRVRQHGRRGGGTQSGAGLTLDPPRAPEHTSRALHVQT